MTGNPEPGVQRPRRPRPDQPLRARWDPIADDPETDEPGRKDNALARFAAMFGWRAYAIPVLAILTIVLLVVTVRGGDDNAEASATPADQRNVNVTEEKHAIGAPTVDIQEEALPAGALPVGGPYTRNGDKSYRVITTANGQKVGTGGQEYTYTVEVEKGIDPTQYSGDQSFAKLVDATLANKRSWIGDGKVSFRRISSGEPDLRITLTSTGTARELCGYQIKLETSCFYPPEERVVLNEARWVRGATVFAGDDMAYRQYLINHEVGHGIGYEKHRPCEENGALAPIMMQQTFGTANSEILALDPEMKADRSLVCKPNSWPFPG